MNISLSSGRAAGFGTLMGQSQNVAVCQDFTKALENIYCCLLENKMETAGLENLVK